MSTTSPLKLPATMKKAARRPFSSIAYLNLVSQPWPRLTVSNPKIVPFAFYTWFLPGNE